MVSSKPSNFKIIKVGKNLDQIGFFILILLKLAAKLNTFKLFYSFFP